MKEKTSGSIHNNSAFKQHPLTTTQIAQPLTQYTFLCLSCQCQACKFKSAPLFCQNQKTHFMSAKQLFYERRIMELQSILNDILSVSQVDLFWKAWPWQSDMACVTLLNFMSTAEIGGYSQYNKNYFRGFQIFEYWLCGNKHIFKTVQIFIAMPVAFKQNIVYIFFCCPIAF